MMAFSNAARMNCDESTEAPRLGRTRIGAQASFRVGYGKGEHQMTRAQGSIRLRFLCGIVVWAGAALSSEVCAQSNQSDPFTMIALSSTYENQDILAKQTQWVHEHAKEMNVVLVVHMGDSVRDNTERSGNGSRSRPPRSTASCRTCRWRATTKAS
jgi:hypothetical protein